MGGNFVVKDSPNNGIISLSFIEVTLKIVAYIMLMYVRDGITVLLSKRGDRVEGTTDKVKKKAKRMARGIEIKTD